VTGILRNAGRYANFPNGSGFVKYDSFYVLKESITRSRKQLAAIDALTPIQKQFIGTLVDTEIAAGYYLKLHKMSSRPAWIAYVAIKMKFRGDVALFAALTGGLPPSRTLNMNTISHSLDLRWSKQIQGIVAYTLLREVRQYLHNEKSIIEVDCILKHGPAVPSSSPHPFVACGATHVRRGVWFWPQIDGENNGRAAPAVDK